MSWPLDRKGAALRRGLEEILVVEEKRQLIEYQIKEELYNWKEGVRAPRVVGKFDDSGEWSRSGGQPAGTWLLPAHYEHSPAMVARAIAQRLEKLNMDSSWEVNSGNASRSWTSRRSRREAARHGGAPALFLLRLPAQHLYARARGQPRHRGHRLPFHGGVDEPAHRDLHAHGRRGRAVDRPGAVHRREAHLRQPRRRHLLPFGMLAIRAAVAAKVTMTYKILYNDAVAMTGGQRHDGPLDPAMISRQIAAEGVKPIVVVTDEPENTRAAPPGRRA